MQCHTAWKCRDTYVSSRQQPSSILLLPQKRDISKKVGDEIIFFPLLYLIPRLGVSLISARHYRALFFFYGEVHYGGSCRLNNVAIQHNIFNANKLIFSKYWALFYFAIRLLFL